MKRIVTVLLACAALGSLTGCGQRMAGAAELRADAHSVSGKETDSDFRHTQTAFALDLFRHTIRQEGDADNLLISPYSVMQALAMTANGADGQTRDEMEQLLGGGIPLDDLNAYLYTWRNGQPHTDTCKLDTANSIWFRDAEGFDLRQAFLQTNADFYAASAYKAPFDQSTVDDINKWVDTHTDHMIPTLIDEISGADMMYLINAVAFDAKWAVKYEDNHIEEGIFTDAAGQQISTDMMHSTEHAYLECADAVGFIKPYQGSYDFIAILPDYGITPAQWLDEQDADSLTAMLDNSHTVDVKAAMPPFTYECGMEMQYMLADMGMPTAFTEAADFSRMSDTGLMIDRVVHKTFIDVNAEGTKAAAVTSVMMKTNGLAPAEDVRYVTLDHPFLYMIYDREARLPVFIGTLETLPATK